VSFTPVPYTTFSPQTAIVQGATRTRLGTAAAVGTSGSDAASSLACRELWISADAGNSGSVYVGDVTVTTAGAGHVLYKLAAGGTLVMQVANANLDYIDGSAASQTVYWGVLDA
jgi:hypothetical protein